MTNPLQTIPNLPASTGLSGSEEVWINQAGVDRRTTTQAIGLLNAIPGPPGPPGPSSETGPYTGQVTQTFAQVANYGVLNIFSYLTLAQQAAVQNGTSNLDFSPILTTALSAVAGGFNPVNGIAPTNIIYFPPGLYRFLSTVNIKYQVILCGAGGSGLGAGAGPTLFSFPINTTGFIINTNRTFGNTTLGSPTTGADGSIIRDISIQAVNGSTDFTTIGIWCRARAAIINCTIGGFGYAQIQCLATAGSGGATEGNANGCLIDSCTVQGNSLNQALGSYMGINGIVFSLADANAGETRHINCLNLLGWGILDNSFLGNTHTAPEAAQCGLQSFANQATATFTGSGSGTNLTASAVTGTIFPGELVTGTGIPTNTTVLSQSSGTTGGAGVYVTSSSTTVSGSVTATGSFTANQGTTTSLLGSTQPGTNSSVWVLRVFNALWQAWVNGGTYYPGGHYSSPGLNATVLWSNAYGEGDHVGPSYMGQKTVVLNGIEGQAGDGWEGPGAYLYSNNSGFAMQGAIQSTADATTATLGGAANTGYIITAGGSWRLNYGIVTGDITENYNNLGSQFVSIHSGPGTSFTFGYSTAKPFVTFARYLAVNDLGGGATTTATTSLASTTSLPSTTGNPVGQIAFNRTPSLGSPIGWIETARGTPDVWQPFGSVGSFSGVVTVGDAAKTLVVGTDPSTQVWNTTLTADRAVTLSTSGAFNGAKYRIVRNSAATGAFNLNVGTGPLKALAAAGAWVDVEYNGSSWIETASGSL